MNDTARSDSTGTAEAHGGHGASHKAPRTRKELGWLSLGALGVVYGDIGTSPLYAMKECFGPVNPHRANATDPDAVLGVLSLVFWSLLLIVCVKYLAFVLRAHRRVRAI